MSTDNFQLFELRHYEALPSPGFEEWLAEQHLSLACTVSAAHLVCVGLSAQGKLAVTDNVFERCLGLTVPDNQTLYMSTRFQIWRLENALPAGQVSRQGQDRLFVPQSAHTTGNLLIHDLAVEAAGRLIFVSALFNCLATVSETKNFTALWMPPFISDLTGGVRCRLSGLALKNGRPAYVTSTSRSNTVDEWQQQRAAGGVVIDVATNEVVAADLTMPDSPRWYRDQLWLTNSGAGSLGKIDLTTGRFEPIVFGPGILRGLCFGGDYAIVGVSRPRKNSIYAGLSVEEHLERQHVAPQCGLLVIDLRTGEIAHHLFLLGKPMQEVFDVVALPGVRQPAAVDLNGEEIQDSVTAGPARPLL
jgi:uncharacterized protein (TIGR03032 family)